jgi:hypothetical protein
MYIFLVRLASLSLNIFIMKRTNQITRVTVILLGIYIFSSCKKEIGNKPPLQHTQTDQSTNPKAALAACDNTNRPTINVRLIPLGTLSQARMWIGIAVANDKIAFAGGLDSNYVVSSRVDIYNSNTQNWTTANLSVARENITAVSANNRIFFAGGDYYNANDLTLDNPIPVDVMDIYDAVADTWSAVKLPGKKIYSAATSVGNKLFFVGGKQVDIYDIISGNWTTISMSDGRSDPAVVEADNKVYFAGGFTFQGNDIYGSPIVVPSSKIDIYDNASGAWSFSRLIEGRSVLAGIEAGGKVYFAGGYTSNTNSPPFSTSCAVDVIDANTGNQSIQYLSRRWYDPGLLASKDNKIVFFLPDVYNSEKNECDIYDIGTDTWYIGELSQPILDRPEIISVNNSIYLTGGFLSGGRPFNQVYQLEF